ncbi:MAG: flavin reductase family protein [Bacillota bacterium]|nr:flavin reductase family protein [Bacillota bacterium]
MAPSTKDFRRVMGLFATGVAVVATYDGGHIRAATVNSFTSISLNPLLVLVSLREESRTAEAIRRSEGFSVNILREDGLALANHFAGNAQEGLSFQFLPFSGGPRLAGALASLGLRLETTYPGGDHLLFLGRVEALHEGEPGGPLVFWKGGYRLLRDPSLSPLQAADPFAPPIPPEPIYHET